MRKKPTASRASIAAQWRIQHDVPLSNCFNDISTYFTLTLALAILKARSRGMNVRVRVLLEVAWLQKDSSRLGSDIATDLSEIVV